MFDGRDTPGPGGLPGAPRHSRACLCDAVSWDRIGGADEPGRGPISRPVTVLAAAAAVVLVLAGAVWAVRAGRTIVYGNPDGDVQAVYEYAGARGCLGGEDDERAAMTAQDVAALDPVGAAEFVAAVVRREWTFPRSGDRREGARFVSDEADASVLAPNWSGTVEGDRSSASTVGASYYVEEATAEQVTVSVVYPYEVVRASGAVEALRSTATFVVQVEDGRWTVRSRGFQRVGSEIMMLGDEYVDGC